MRAKRGYSDREWASGVAGAWFITWQSGTTYQPSSAVEFWWRLKVLRSREASNGIAEQSASISPPPTH